MKLTVDVTNPELDALEDVLTAWNLCPSHTQATSGVSYRRIAAWQYGCPRCKRLLDTRVDKSLKMWSKLCSAYDRKS